MISINQAAEQGIQRIRQPRWSNPTDYFKIDIIDGRAGPWIHLFSPLNREVCDQDNPQSLLWILGGADAADVMEFEPYDGPISEDETAQQEGRPAPQAAGDAGDPIPRPSRGPASSGENS